jgi:hypothetical protein
MPNAKSGTKSAVKTPALIVFGRIRGSKVDQAAVFLQEEAEAAKKAALDAGLSCLEVKTDADRKVASTLPAGAINPQGRFSLSPASSKIIAELDGLLKAVTGDVGTPQTPTPRDCIGDDFSRSLGATPARVAGCRSRL